MFRKAITTVRIRMLAMPPMMLPTTIEETLKALELMPMMGNKMMRSGWRKLSVSMVRLMKLRRVQSSRWRLRIQCPATPRIWRKKREWRQRE